MKLPWNKQDSQPAADASAEHTPASTAPEQPVKKGYTPPKGHATPKRNDVERAAGTRKQAYTAPETPKEARARRKALKESMSKEEYKALQERERAERARARELERQRMLSGDERYLLPRDQGPERKLIRDWVDTRRLPANMFMPLVLILLVFMIFGATTKNLMLNNTLSLVGMVFFLFIIIDGIISGRRVSKVVRRHYPDTTLSTFNMGFYAFSRASMVRRFRTPLPQKDIGDELV